MSGARQPTRLLAEPLFLYVATVAIWGTSWYGISLQLTVPALQAIAYRFLLAALMLLGFCWATRRRLRFGARDHFFMAAQGFTLFFLNYFLFYLAASRIASGLLAVCFSTILIWNTINGALIFKTPIDRRVSLGGLLGILGLALVFFPEIRNLELGGAALTGLALSLAATYSASLGNMVTVRHKHAGIPVIESNALGMSYGAIFGLSAALIFSGPLTFDPSPSFMAALVYLALFASVLGFGAYLTLVQKIGADRAAYCTVLFPILALALSTLFEGYRWGWESAVGVGLVLIGNLLVLRRPKT